MTSHGAYTRIKPSLFLTVAIFILSMPAQTGFAGENPPAGLSPEKITRAESILADALSTLKDTTGEVTGKSDSGPRIYYETAKKIHEALGKDSIPALRHILTATEAPELASMAKKVLAKFKSADVNSTITGMLRSTSASKRQLALNEMRKLQARKEITEDTCRNHILPLLTDHDNSIRRLALDILKAYTTRIQGLSGLVIKNLGLHTGPDHEKIESLSLLVSINDAAAREHLLSLASSARGDLHLQAIKYLGHFNDASVVSKLSSLLDQEGSDEVRYKAAASLGRTGSDAAVPALVNALKTDDARLRRISASSLNNITGKNLGTGWQTWERWVQVTKARNEGTYKPGMFREKEFYKKKTGDSEKEHSADQGVAKYAKYLLAIIALGVLLLLKKLLLPGEQEKRLGLVLIPDQSGIKDQALGMDEALMGKEADSYIGDVEAERSEKKAEVASDAQSSAAEKTPREIPEEDIPYLVELFELDQDKSTGESVMNALAKVSDLSIVEKIVSAVLEGRVSFDKTRQLFAVDMLRRNNTNEAFAMLVKIARSDNLDAMLKRKAIEALSESGEKESLSVFLDILAFEGDKRIRGDLYAHLEKILPYDFSDAKNANSSLGSSAIYAGKLRQWYKKNEKKLIWNEKKSRYVLKN